MNDKFNRRMFLKTMLAAGAGSFVGYTKAEEVAGSTPVPVRPFGRTGVDVSILGLGGMFDINTNQIILKQALKYGVTYWDTADCYNGGKSETGIGMYFEKNPDARERVFLVTKSDARDPEGMAGLLARSLDRMKTDYIDLYFIHGIKSIFEMTDDIKAWAARAKKERKIRFFGFSAHSNMEELLQAASGMPWIDAIMMSYNYRLMQSDKMRRAVEACAKAGIGLTAMKTQGGGQIKADSETELKMAGRFLEQGFSDKQAKLKAVWEEPNIACICSQMPNVTILMSNIAAALDKTTLSAENRALLRQYADETCSGYCAGCASLCESVVNPPVPIADVMRHLMYSRHYGDRALAASLFERMPGSARKSLASLDFSRAESVCPNRLPIGRLMREAVQELG